MQPFFRAWADFTPLQHEFLKQEFDCTDLKIGVSYATMNVWVQSWVKGEMCCNNTIKMEWYIYDVPFSPIKCPIKKIAASDDLFIKGWWIIMDCATSKQCKPNWYSRPLHEWEKVYFLRDRWQVQSLQRRNIKTNFAALPFCPFFYEYPKKYWNFFSAFEF